MSTVENAHTVDEALARFELIAGRGDGEDTACAASALSWVHGLAFTDRLPCAHPTLNSMVINANDADDTTVDERKQLVRAGETGLIDTWWLPSIVVAHCISMGRKSDPGDTVITALATLDAVSTWKQTRERIANLRDANLRDANLRDANLRDANLRDANLRDANLRGANLGGANLGGANLGGANLGGANLRDANLGGANLRDADLRGADLRGADLWGADLWGADLWGANLWAAKGNIFTRLPAGWVVADGHVTKAAS